MAHNLSALSDAQALRVLVELFELLPGASKPGYDELTMLVDDLRDGSAAEIGAVLGHLDDAALPRRWPGRPCRPWPLGPSCSRCWTRRWSARAAPTCWRCPS